MQGKISIIGEINLFALMYFEIMAAAQIIITI